MKFINGIAGIFSRIFKVILNIFYILFLSVLAIFFITIFMPDNVVNAIEIFKNLLKIP